MWARGLGRPFRLIDPLGNPTGSIGQRHVHKDARSAPLDNNGRKLSKHATTWIRQAEAEGRPLSKAERQQIDYERRQRAPRWTPESLQHDPVKQDPWWRKRRDELKLKPGQQSPSGDSRKLLAGAQGSRGELQAVVGKSQQAPAIPALQEIKTTFMGASREKFMLKQRQLQDSRDANALAQAYERPPMLEETVLLWSGGVLTRADWFSNRVGQNPEDPQREVPVGDIAPAMWHGDIDQPLYFVDCTTGSGGHAERLLETYPSAQVLCMDMDAEALRQVRDRLYPKFGERLKFHHGSFSDICIPDDGVSPAFQLLGAGSPEVALEPQPAAAVEDGTLTVSGLPAEAPAKAANPHSQRFWTRTQDLSSHSSLTFTLGPQARSMLLRRLGWPDKIHGLLVDTGPSVAQSTCRWRGFSLFSDKGLDMRYDLPPVSHIPTRVRPKRPRRGSNIDGRLTAADLLNTAEFWELERVFTVLDGPPIRDAEDGGGLAAGSDRPNASALKYGRDGVLCGTLPMILTRLLQVHREGVPDSRCPDTKRVIGRTIESAVELTTLVQDGLETLHRYFFLPEDESIFAGKPDFHSRGFKLRPNQQSLLVNPAGRRESSGDAIEDLRSLSREEVMSVPEWLLVCRKDVFQQDIRGRPLPTTGRSREIRHAIARKSNFRLVAASAFSTLRRAVNRELDHLAQIIRCSPQLLMKDGSLVVITGTRIEDEVVMDGLKMLTSQGSRSILETVERQHLTSRSIHNTIKENSIMDWSTVPRVVMPALAVADGRATFGDHGELQPGQLKALRDDDWAQDLLPKLEDPLELETGEDNSLTAAVGALETKPATRYSPEVDPISFDFLVGEQEELALRPKKADRLLSRSRLRVSRLRAVRRVTAPEPKVADDPLKVSPLRRRTGLFGQAMGNLAADGGAGSRR